MSRGLYRDCNLGVKFIFFSDCGGPYCELAGDACVSQFFPFIRESDEFAAHNGFQLIHSFGDSPGERAEGHRSSTNAARACLKHAS